MTVKTRFAMTAAAGLAIASLITPPAAWQGAAAAPLAHGAGVDALLTPAWDRPVLAGSSNWMIARTPHVYGPNGLITDVSCTYADACTAVGTAVDRAGLQETLAERWNGTSWAIQSTPNPRASTSNGLNGVACPTTGYCVAVGTTENGPFSEVWNGTAWSIQQTPLPQGGLFAALVDVACTRTSFCVAVGHDVTVAGVEVDLSEIWNGTSWHPEPAQNPVGNPASGLSAVSCTAATACTAVGGYQKSTGGGGALAEAWNGHSWKLQSVQQPSGASNASLEGVSCSSAVSCIAVGSDIGPSGQVTLAESWNGTSWQVQDTPNPAGAADSVFSRVSCSAGSCVAVGFSVTGSYANVPLAEAWNGSAWALEDSVSPKGSAGGALEGVACWTSARCIAVGSWYNAEGTQEALAEARIGTGWTTQAVRDVAASLGTVFNGVSCTSVEFCTAVGSDGPGSLVERWTGKTWQVSRSPQPAGVSTDLYGVSCATAASCVAVGVGLSSAQPIQALAQSWNGTAWRLDKVPAPSGSISATFDGASCPSASFCMAVGSYLAQTGAQGAMAETWNGKTWKQQSPATPAGSPSATLDSVSCTGARSCTAVGGYTTSTGGNDNLVETWNGHAWTIRSAPAPGDAMSSGLSSVACASAAFCAAVGDYISSTYAELPTSDVWNGSGWALSRVPDLQGSKESILNGVSCPGPASCSAVGTLIGRSGLQITSAFGWNGSAWAVEATPAPRGSVASSLDGTSCAAASSCTAVGGYENSRLVSQTLAEFGP